MGSLIPSGRIEMCLLEVDIETLFINTKSTFIDLTVVLAQLPEKLLNLP
jgi:hypothetical protein